MKFTKQYYEIKEGIAYIYDSKGMIFKVDEEDLELLEKFGRSWSTFTTTRSNGKYYVQSQKDKKTYYLHRFLMGLNEPRKQVDHINGDPLDNRRINLRIVTDSQNKQNRHKLDNRNTSGVRGVFWNKQKNKWHAKAQIERKQIHVGFFDSLEEAELAVKEARRQIMTHANEVSDTPITDWKKPIGRETGSKSGIHGVCWDKRANKWMAITTKNRKNIYHGSFDTIEEAKEAVKKAREGRQ